MKKRNWTMRAGVLMVALTLITSCFVGGTFAKYVTTGTGTDTARVARWGVTVVGAGNAFAKEYTKTDGTFSLETNTVISAHPGAGTHKVIAPGTNGELSAFTLGGTPEVAVRITYSISKLDIGSKWTDGSNPYCPVILVLKQGTIVKKMFTFKDTATDNADKMLAEINKELAKLTVEVAPNTDLNSGITENQKVTLAWEWPFEGTQSNLAMAGTPAVPAGWDTYQTDVKDTFLGDAAAKLLDGAGITDYPYIDVEMSATVTQVD